MDAFMSDLKELIQNARDAKASSGKVHAACDARRCEHWGNTGTIGHFVMPPPATPIAGGYHDVASLLYQAVSYERMRPPRKSRAHLNLPPFKFPRALCGVVFWSALR